MGLLFPHDAHSSSGIEVKEKQHDYISLFVQPTSLLLSFCSFVPFLSFPGWTDFMNGGLHPPLFFHDGLHIDHCPIYIYILPYIELCPFSSRCVYFLIIHQKLLILPCLSYLCIKLICILCVLMYQGMNE